MNGIVLTKSNKLIKGEILAPNKPIDDLSTFIKIVNTNSIDLVNVMNIAFVMVAIDDTHFNIWSDGKVYTSNSEHFRKLWNRFSLAN